MRQVFHNEARKKTNNRDYGALGEIINLNSV